MLELELVLGVLVMVLVVRVLVLVVVERRELVVLVQQRERGLEPVVVQQQRHRNLAARNSRLSERKQRMCDHACFYHYCTLVVRVVAIYIIYGTNMAIFR